MNSVTWQEMITWKMREKVMKQPKAMNLLKSLGNLLKVSSKKNLKFKLLMRAMPRFKKNISLMKVQRKNLKTLELMHKSKCFPQIMFLSPNQQTRSRSHLNLKKPLRKHKRTLIKKVKIRMILNRKNPNQLTLRNRLRIKPKLR